MTAERVDLDPVRVSRMVAAQFPQWAHLPVRPVPVSGWDNRTFRLGDELSVRLPSAECYVAQVAKEQRWLPVLGPHLPLPIPQPVAAGRPAEGYPWPWSVYRWLEGSTAQAADIADPVGFAIDLARFLNRLRRVEAAGGPAAGAHNFFRGGPLYTYDAETRTALSTLATRVDGRLAGQLWQAALDSTYPGPPVWVHGDISPGNLLVADGRLAAVIDFGSSGVGDPACDLVIAWSLLRGASRQAFRDELALDAGHWARARGWALWKSLITLASEPDSTEADQTWARQVLVELFAEAAGQPGRLS